MSTDPDQPENPGLEAFVHDCATALGVGVTMYDVLEGIRSLRSDLTAVRGELVRVEGERDEARADAKRAHESANYWCRKYQAETGEMP